MKTLRAKAFPNGEVRVVMFTPVSRVQNETHTETELLESEINDPSPLTLGENSNRHTKKGQLAHLPRPGHGATGKCETFTQNGRRKILRAGGAIDKVIDSPSQCIFLTGTLPGGTEGAKRAIAEWSSYAIQLVQSWLGKRVPGKLLIYAWEFQKRGALHLHLTMVCKDDRVRSQILSEWKGQWTRVIDGICSKSGINCWERKDGHDYSDGKKHVLQTDAQECRASAAAYLSKYLSKSNLQQDCGYQRDYHPARYWGISRPLCALVEELTEDTEVYISRDDKAREVYEDCLSVMQSTSDSAYNWKARVGDSVAAVAYKKQNYLEELWSPVKKTIESGSNWSFVGGMLTDVSKERLQKLTISLLTRLREYSIRDNPGLTFSFRQRCLNLLQQATSSEGVIETVMRASIVLDLSSQSQTTGNKSKAVRVLTAEVERTLRRVEENEHRKAEEERAGLMYEDIMAVAS